jgi:hypothetical protein
MSILADFGAGFFGNLSQQMQRKRELNEKLDEEKRSEKRETARFDRQLAAQREGEDRRLGREVDPSRPAEFNDEAGTVTTYYMDGTSRTRQMTADEKRERQQGIEDRELNSRYKNALIAQMGRSGGRGGSGGNNDYAGGPRAGQRRRSGGLG